MTIEREPAVLGCILGTAIGDAVGLPCEGLSRARQSRLYPNLDRYHLLFGRGMVSDDTEHACMVAQSLIASAGDPDRFVRHFAQELRLWTLGIPPGIGFGTLRACLKLCAGAGWQCSGVYSAGNGPAMRSALLGICFGHSLGHLRQLLYRSTWITHTDPKAEYGALAVALAAHMAVTQPDVSPAEYWYTLRGALPGPHGSPRDLQAEELVRFVECAATSAAAGRTTSEFADSLGLHKGVSGYMYHTVPVALHAWMRHPRDFQKAVVDVVRCGGDTDTTGAIVGGIVGAGVGPVGLPEAWLHGLVECPRTVEWMTRLAGRLASVLASGQRGRPQPAPLVLVWPRNAVFLSAVLFHGFRRLLPPY